MGIACIILATFLQVWNYISKWKVTLWKRFVIFALWFLWAGCVSSPNFYVETLRAVCWRQEGLWEMTGSWGRSPQEWGQYPYERSSRELPSPFPQERTQWEDSVYEPESRFSPEPSGVLVLGLQPPELLGIIHLINYPICGVLHSSLNGLRQ